MKALNKVIIDKAIRLEQVQTDVMLIFRELTKEDFLDKISDEDRAKLIEVLDKKYEDILQLKGPLIMLLMVLKANARDLNSNFMEFMNKIR